MDEVTIWHNPRCSKSRAALKLLEERGIAARVRLYLSDPPDATELVQVRDMLGVRSRYLMRRQESPYRDLDLAAVEDEARLIEAMARHPILIERPIVMAGGRAAIGRPPEAVLAILPD